MRELNLVEEHIQAMSALRDRDLKNKASEVFRHWRRVHRKTGAVSIEARIKALSLTAAIVERTLRMRPYRVQILASLALLERCAVQMSPGEGKTLSIAMAAVLNGWPGPCHVITANDYLARRDAEFLEPLYKFCGLNVSFVDHEVQPSELASRYQADIVYATGKQLLADFLRDRLLLKGTDDPQRRLLWELRSTSHIRRPVMRGLYSAVVDEADSVLIDEAVTPLIISRPDDNRLLLEAAQISRDIVDELEPHEDYIIDEIFRDVHFSDRGEERVKELTQRLSPLWRAPERRHDLLSQAIIARDMFHRDRHYVVEDGKVIIVDENTGRVMPGRSWSYGMHQAVEAREGVELTKPSRTMARMSFQDFFRRYHSLAGASGTLHGIGGELWGAYRLPVFRVSTRLPSLLRVKPPTHFNDREEKLRAMIMMVRELNQKGAPILVGTRRIMDSEILADALRGSGIPCMVLNAKQHAHEAEVIAIAGERGRVTVATNMAGRGTDIKLGPGVEELGGLHVLMFEPHESARVDWQLFGRAGRQGSPGQAQPFASMDEDLLRHHLPAVVKPLWWLAHVPRYRHWLMGSLLWIAQQRAQWRAWVQRKRLLRRESEVNKQLSFTSDHDLAAGLSDSPVDRR